MARKYQIIYADPPWPENSTMASGSSPTNHYPCMTKGQLLSFPVIREVADENCLLFLWSPARHLEFAFNCANGWGFKYSTVAFVWNKRLPVVGMYNMTYCEFVLLFKKGKVPLPYGARNVKQYVEVTRTFHSKKPEEVRKRIEQMFPKASRIELFARQTSPGWDVWGNEVECASVGSP